MLMLNCFIFADYDTLNKPGDAEKSDESTKSPTAYENDEIELESLNNGKNSSHF